MKVISKLTLGSRLYNLHNDKSDYDILQLYKRPLKDYLTLGKFNDYLPDETVGNTNCKFWDIMKFLRLAEKNSWGAFEAMVAFESGMYDFLASEMVYLNWMIPSSSFGIRSLLFECYGVVTGNHHRGYIKALRYVAAQYMLQKQIPPPTLDAWQLLDMVYLPAEIHQEIINVFVAKVNGVKDKPFNLELDKALWQDLPETKRNFDNVFYETINFIT